MRQKYPTKKLGEVLENVPRIVGVLSKENLVEGEYPIIDQGQSLIAGYTNNAESVYRGELPVVIFGDHTRSIKYIDFPFAVGADGTKILKTVRELESKFFYYFLQSIDIPARGYARHFSLLRKFEIPVPSIEEQRKIVERIEKQFVKIDEIARVRAESESVTAQLLSAALHEIFSQSELKGWKEINLGDSLIMKMTSGGTPSRSNKSFYTGEIAWLKSGELGDNTEIIDSEEHISEEAEQKSSAKIFPTGTVLLAMYGATAGKLGILKKPASTNQAVAGLIPDISKLDSKYLFYCLLHIREEVVGKAWGGAQPNLSQTILKTFKIPVPTIAEQKKIVKKLDALSKKVRALQSLQSAQAADLKALKQSILHEAFSGALD